MMSANDRPPSGVARDENVRAACVGALLLALASALGVSGSAIAQSGSDERSAPSARPVVRGAVGVARNENGCLVHEATSEFHSGTTKIRVLLPAKAAVNGRRFPVLYVLPVEAGDETQWGSRLKALRAAKIPDRYGVICVLPTFSHLPWYADHPDRREVRQESYFLHVVEPFIRGRYPVKSGKENRLLVGFSKSGWGAFSLLVRNPERFGRAAAWDAPLTMSTPAKYGAREIFATQTNFERYRIETLVELRREALKPLSGQPRLLLLGYDNFRDHHQNLHGKLKELGVAHTYRDGPKRRHHWESGWLEEAVALLMDSSASSPRERQEPGSGPSNDAARQKNS